MKQWECIITSVASCPFAYDKYFLVAHNVMCIVIRYSTYLMNILVIYLLDCQNGVLMPQTLLIILCFWLWNLNEALSFVAHVFK